MITQKQMVITFGFRVELLVCNMKRKEIKGGNESLLITGIKYEQPFIEGKALKMSRL